jgi:hypothetical protein
MLLRALASVTTATCVACAPAIPPEDWTCDFDASESRPLGDPDATPDEAGVLPPAACEVTCGPPATSCTATTLEGGVPGAICPVCTF